MVGWPKRRYACFMPKPMPHFTLDVSLGFAHFCIRVTFRTPRIFHTFCSFILPAWSCSLHPQHLFGLSCCISRLYMRGLRHIWHISLSRHLLSFAFPVCRPRAARPHPDVHIRFVFICIWTVSFNSHHPLDVALRLSVLYHPSSILPSASSCPFKPPQPPLPAHPPSSPAQGRISLHIAFLRFLSVAYSAFAFDLCTSHLRASPLRRAERIESNQKRASLRLTQPPARLACLALSRRRCASIVFVRGGMTNDGARTENKLGGGGSAVR